MWTSIGRSPHPPTCMGVGWVFIYFYDEFWVCMVFSFVSFMFLFVWFVHSPSNRLASSTSMLGVFVIPNSSNALASSTTSSTLGNCPAHSSFPFDKCSMLYSLSPLHRIIWLKTLCSVNHVRFNLFLG